MIKSKKQMYVVIGVFALIMLLGTVTYAFFNYTRTGSANTISTGQINFLTTQSNTLSLTNVFPMASSEVTNANLDEVEIRIQGDTTYSGGEEFEITVEGLTNTIGTSPNEKTIPINFVARYVPTATGDNIGSAAVSDYFAERGSTTTVYELTESGIATNGKQILVGYIPANGEIDGTLKVSAYIDSSNIAISDTYYENVTTTPTPSAPNDEYGTTTEWVNGRTVLTTAEWNALQNAQVPLSFKIKAVSQEGIWVEEPAPVLPTMAEMCPGCVFKFVSSTTLNFGANGSILQLGDYSSNYEDVLDEERDAFMGMILDSTTGRINRAFACGMKSVSGISGKVPFCIENVIYNDERTQEVQQSNIAILHAFWGVDKCTSTNSNIECYDYIDENEGIYTYAGFYINDLDEYNLVEYRDQYGFYSNVGGRQEYPVLYNDW